MRILVISNLYPPEFVGGYELGCRDVVEGLRARGHRVRVLTSSSRGGSADGSDAAWRWLPTRLGQPPGAGRVSRLVAEARFESRSRRAFLRAYGMFRPDVIYLWNLTHLSINLGFLAAGTATPVAYFVSDDWLTRWDTDEWYLRWHRPPDGRIGRLRWRLSRGGLKLCGLVSKQPNLPLTNLDFASDWLKRYTGSCRSLHSGRVIRWGVDLAAYPFREIQRAPRRLLYVGQVSPHKGVLTAVEAMHRLSNGSGGHEVSLTIVGGSITPDYVAAVKRQVCHLGLTGRVDFMGKVARDALQPVYAAHDILLFTSTWEEPFAITPLEAMASGLTVVSTTTGGTPELIAHGQNGLTFAAGNAVECAERVRHLLGAADANERIRRAGRRTIEERFSIGRMIGEVERSLVRSIALGSGSPA